jgi:hypothetical protein
MTKRKPPPQVLTSIDIVGTVYMPVKDPAQAIEEANAARLATAAYKQAIATGNIWSAVFGTGPTAEALQEGAAAVLKAKRGIGPLLANNEAKKRERETRKELFHDVVRKLYAQPRAAGRKDPRLETPNGLAVLVQKELEKQVRGKVFSVRTIVRALQK